MHYLLKLLGPPQILEIYKRRQRRQYFLNFTKSKGPHLKDAVWNLLETQSFAGYDLWLSRCSSPLSARLSQPPWQAPQASLRLIQVHHRNCPLSLSVSRGMSLPRPGLCAFGLLRHQPSPECPKNAQTTAQLHSSHMLARLCSKSFKLGFSSIWTSRCI